MAQPDEPMMLVIDPALFATPGGEFAAMLGLPGGDPAGGALTCRMDDPTGRRGRSQPLLGNVAGARDLSAPRFEAARPGQPVLASLPGTFAPSAGKLSTGSDMALNLVGPIIDAAGISKLIETMGGAADRIEEVVKNGRRYIILKGKSAGMREALRGVRYLADNAKVVRLGIGSSGLRHAVKATFFVQLVFFTVHDVTRYFIEDEATFSDLVGSLGSKAIIAGVAAIAGYGAGLLVPFAVGTATLAATGAVTVVALPAAAGLAVAMAVGLGVALALDATGVDTWLEQKISDLFDAMADGAERAGRYIAARWRDTVVPGAITAYDASRDTAGCLFDQFGADDRNLATCWR